MGRAMSHARDAKITAAIYLGLWLVYLGSLITR
jgi:hypothetical protein